MSLFDTNALVPVGGTIEGIITTSRIEEVPSQLIWNIVIYLQPLTINELNLEAELHFNYFSLPFQSSPIIDSSDRIPRSWKELENQKYLLADPTSESIGAIYYVHKFSIETTANTHTEIDETFDNAVNVYSVSFGRILGRFIEVVLQLKIDFSYAYIHTPPFANELECPLFELKTALLIYDARFLDGNFSVKDVNQARLAAEQCLDLQDYQIIPARRKTFQPGTKQWLESEEIRFEPNFYGITSE